jgi:enoyl-CoA hydratase
MASYKHIQFEERNSVGIITLDRPDALNALSTDLMQDIITAMESAQKSKDVRVIIITGGGEKAFAAGADIKEMQPQTFSTMMANDIYGRINAAFATCTKPVIAAVNGYALGGGCELAMMCDFILASSKAKFGQPEIKLGTLPGIGGSQRLTKLVGKSKAMELCLTGRMIDAEEADRIGLAARVFNADTFMDDVMAVAEEIANYSQLALALVKDVVNQAEDMPLSQGLDYERKVFYGSFATHDQKEGMNAFLEKREPVFKDE